MRKAKWSLVLALLVVLIGGSIYFVAAPSTPPTVYPTPNAFDTIAHAHSLMQRLPEDWENSSDAELLRSSLAANQSALEVVEQAFEQDYMLRLYDADPETGMAGNANSLRPIIRLLLLRARLQSLEGQSFAAAETLLQTADLARKSRAGGYILHTLIANAGERTAMEKLDELIDQLSAEERASILKQLVAVDRGVLDAETILQRERNAVLQTQGKIRGTLMLWASGGVEKASDQCERVDREIEQQYQALIDRLSGDSVLSEE